MKYLGARFTFPFINLGFIKLPLYGLCIVTGILSGGAISYKLCSRLNKNFYDFIIISAVVTLFGFLFAKLLYLLTAFPVKKFFQVLWLMLRHPISSGLIETGFVFYGGLIGGTLGYFAGIKIARCTFRDFLNLFAFVIPYIHAWGRVGCFCAGCCYGIHYDGPLAVHYTNPVSDVVCGPGIFPVQLLEALLLFAFAIVILILLLRGRGKNNLLFLWYALYYSIVRFCLEFLRGDEARGQLQLGAISLSVSQVISVIVMITVILCLVKTIIPNLFLKPRMPDQVQPDTDEENI